MKRGRTWYKREPVAFLDGVQGIGPELIGAYAVLLDLLYARAGECVRDDRHLSGILGCSVRKARALTDALVRLGKIEFRDGFVSNSRAKSECFSARTEREIEPNPNKNNEVEPVDKRREEKKKTKTKKEAEVPSFEGDFWPAARDAWAKVLGSPPGDKKAALDTWNRLSAKAKQMAPASIELLIDDIRAERAKNFPKRNPQHISRWLRGVEINYADRLEIDDSDEVQGEEGPVHGAPAPSPASTSDSSELLPDLEGVDAGKVRGCAGQGQLGQSRPERDHQQPDRRGSEEDPGLGGLSQQLGLGSWGEQERSGAPVPGVAGGPPISGQPQLGDAHGMAERLHGEQPGRPQASPHRHSIH